MKRALASAGVLLTALALGLALFVLLRPEVSRLRGAPFVPASASAPFAASGSSSAPLPRTKGFGIGMTSLPGSDEYRELTVSGILTATSVTLVHIMSGPVDGCLSVGFVAPDGSEFYFLRYGQMVGGEADCSLIESKIHCARTFAVRLPVYRLHVVGACDISIGFSGEQLEEAQLEGDCTRRWAGAVEAEGGIAGDRSVVVSPLVNADGTEGDGGYVVKGVLGRSDEKEGRTPWNLLEDYTTKGDEQAGILWKEYAAAISGKQRLSWSPEVRALGVSDDYQPEGGQLVRKVSGDEWAEAVRPEADSRAALLVRARKGRS